MALPSHAQLYRAPLTGAQRTLQELAPHPALAVDLEAHPDNLRRAAEARSTADRDIVLLTADASQLDLATNLVANLNDVGVTHYLLLLPKRDCLRISTRLACVWTTLMQPFRARLVAAHTNLVRASWLCRQIYVGRLSRLGFNPMVLDADTVLFRNPFPLIHKHLANYHAIFLGDVSAGYMSANGGTVYLRNASADGPVGMIWRHFERRVFELLNSTDEFPSQLPHKTRRGVVGGPGVPADALLYDQNVLDWCIVGQIIGDTSFVGRGFSPTMRSLSDAEREQVKWQNEPAELRTPDGFSCPGDGYDETWFPRSIALRVGGRVERLLRAPSWLFTAESDDHQSIVSSASREPSKRYGRTRRLSAGHWSLQPAPTTLAHFVCSVFPGSDGRRLGMRLLRRWFEADVNWVLAAAAAPDLPARGFRFPFTTSKPTPRYLVAFSKTVPFDGVRAGNAASQKLRLQTWNILLAYAALHTRRSAVVPLFECKGVLAPHSRYGWVIHADRGNAPAAERRMACAYRMGTGCFRALGYPEEVAQLAPSEIRSVEVSPVLLASGGLGAFADLLRNDSHAAPTSSQRSLGLLLDVTELAAHPDVLKRATAALMGSPEAPTFVGRRLLPSASGRRSREGYPAQQGRQWERLQASTSTQQGRKWLRELAAATCPSDFVYMKPSAPYVC